MTELLFRELQLSRPVGALYRPMQFELRDYGLELGNSILIDNSQTAADCYLACQFVDGDYGIRPALVLKNWYVVKVDHA